MKRQKYETSERKSDLEPVFRIRIRIGSAFDRLLDPEPYPHITNADPKHCMEHIEGTGRNSL
jgi:hypothetical protein